MQICPEKDFYDLVITFTQYVCACLHTLKVGPGKCADCESVRCCCGFCLWLGQNPRLSFVCKVSVVSGLVGKLLLLRELLCPPAGGLALVLLV